MDLFESQNSDSPIFDKGRVNTYLGQPPVYVDAYGGGIALGNSRESGHLVIFKAVVMDGSRTNILCSRKDPICSRTDDDLLRAAYLTMGSVVEFAP